MLAHLGPMLVDGSGTFEHKQTRLIDGQSILRNSLSKAVKRHERTAECLPLLSTLDHQLLRAFSIAE
jgi:hypothetical protein